MTYECVAFYRLPEVGSIPADPVGVLHRCWTNAPGDQPFGGHVTAHLTKTPHALAPLVDHRLAIATTTLNHGADACRDAELVALASARIAQTRVERHPDAIYLVISIEADISPPAVDGAMLVIDLGRSRLVYERPGRAVYLARDSQSRHIESRVLAGLALTRGDCGHHVAAGRASSLTDDNGTRHLDIWLDASASAGMQRGIGPNETQALTDGIKQLAQDPDIGACLELAAASLEHGLDPALEFLVSFTALEQFLNTWSSGRTLRARLASLLSEAPAPQGAMALETEFESLYRLRNQLAHEGKRIIDREHSQRVRKLLASLLEFRR